MEKNLPEHVIRLSVSEAARILGVDSKTIRRAIQQQEVRYVVIRGRYKIHLGSLIRWSQKNLKLQNKVASKGIGQYVGQWKIKNTLYSPNPEGVKGKEEDENNNQPNNNDER